MNKDSHIEELKAIIKDFMTTKEDLRTWREEMYGTIVEVVGEFEEDDE